MTKREQIQWVLAALAVAAFLAPFASSFPDGLERVAEEKLFIQRAGPAQIAGIMPDYQLPRITDERVSTAGAGVIGALLVCGLVWGAGTLIARKGERSE